MNESVPIQVVLEFYETLRDSRINDMLGLVDPEIVCHPLVRPGLTLYSGYDGMIQIDMITEQEGPQVTVQAKIVPEPGRGQSPLPVMSVYKIRDSLITSIESLAYTPVSR